ncbi:hypothetical protein [Pseudoalteromonas sp. T1lg23B]|uniref:hypothetical protein n=1 Tax=Pseudoalteromonas sp. T1lg23B TaxID=2077097 RepID=UPI000CF72EE2|nr:hypothetical protein [Pseudoalteromonas sp. T1lg23B]
MFFELSGLSLHFDTVIVIGMVLAFLFNFSFFILKLNTNKSLLLTSGLMAGSYFLSNHFYDIDIPAAYMYLQWLAYDVVSILCIWGLHKLTKQPFSISSIYVFVGLTVNSLLFALMHLDIVVLGNKQQWWFWTVYSASVNFFDLMMVVALILNRDFLFIESLSNKIKALFKASSVLNTK